MKHLVLSLVLALGGVLVALAAGPPSGRDRQGTAAPGIERGCHGQHLHHGVVRNRPGSVESGRRGSRRRSAPVGPHAVQLPSDQRMEPGEPRSRPKGRSAFRRSCSICLSDCVNYSRASDGAFDITVGPLMKVWGFYKGTGHLPHRAEIRGALAQCRLPEHRAGPRPTDVRFAQRGRRDRPGRHRQRLRSGPHGGRFSASNGITSALVSAPAAASMRSARRPANRAAGRSASRIRKTRRRPVEDVYLKDESLSTSGNYEKFFFAEGKM